MCARANFQSRRVRKDTFYDGLANKLANGFQKSHHSDSLLLDRKITRSAWRVFIGSHWTKFGWILSSFVTQFDLIRSEMDSLFNATLPWMCRRWTSSDRVCVCVCLIIIIIGCTTLNKFVLKISESQKFYLHWNADTDDHLYHSAMTMLTTVSSKWAQIV